MSPPKPHVSVVIVNWNGKHFLKPCLDSLFRQSYKPYDVYLIDNASTDGSVKFVEQNYMDEIKSGKLKVTQNNRNYGFAEGNNIGIRQALENPDVKYIAALNTDTIVDKDWLEKLVTATERDKKIGMSQGKILLMDRKKIDSTGLLFYRSATWWDRGENEKDTHQYDSKREVFGVTAAAALYRREMLEDTVVGDEFFDSDFFGYCEDIDLSVRGKLRGWRAIYEPSAIVYHHRGGITGPQTIFQVYHTQRNNLLLIFKSLPAGFVIRNLPLIILTQLSGVVIYAHRCRLPVFLRAKLSAVRMLGQMLIKRKKVMEKGIKLNLSYAVEKNILPPVSAVPSSP